MGEHKKISIVVPVYNALGTLGRTAECLVNQTIGQEALEVLLVDDGSHDGSGELCDEIAQLCPQTVRVIHKENGGEANARNTGIKAATGEYVMFVDADDTISPNAAEDVVRFFDAHRDEIDLVSLTLKYVYANGKEHLHPRNENVLVKTGVYDLADRENQYISLTTINICVKNSETDRPLFQEDMAVGEDQMYIAPIVATKGKIGYVEEAVYYYDRTAATMSGEPNNPLYSYGNMKSLFSKLQELGKQHPSLKGYYDALILYNLNFRILQDRLLPYYMDDEALEVEKEYFRNLVSNIDDLLILEHPTMDRHHRFFILSWKKGQDYHVEPWRKKLALYNGDTLLDIGNNVEVVLYKFAENGARATFYGFLKSPFFSFMAKPKFSANVEVGGKPSEIIDIDLTESAHGYYRSKMKTNVFWDFEITLDCTRNSSTELRVEYEGHSITVNPLFILASPFGKSDKVKRWILRDNRKYLVDQSRIEVSILSEDELKECQKAKLDYYKTKKLYKPWMVRKWFYNTESERKRIWLYYDCKGVRKDNGLRQFLHDCEIDDGIVRYFVYNDDREIFSSQVPPHVQNQLVEFGCKKHKMLFLQAEKVITAFIERDNVNPFPPKTYEHYKDLANYEMVYLQHGVLHASCPWKYSFDRLDINKVVVSTTFELDSFTQKYHYPIDALIPSGMPRYDELPADAPYDKRVLFAPSWRNYLLNGKDEDGSWRPNEKKLLKSNYYKEVRAFLQSNELNDLLSSRGYELDFKLHPIFSCYRDAFQFENTHIHFVEDIADASRYEVFVTDISSYCFDFLYLKRPVMYFIPDYAEFKAGLATYRDLDVPLDDGFGPLATDSIKAIEVLEDILANGVEDKYRGRCEELFLHYDNRQCDRLYEYLAQN